MSEARGKGFKYEALETYDYIPLLINMFLYRIFKMY